MELCDNESDFANQETVKNLTRWECISAYLSSNPIDENEDGRKKPSENTVLYTRRYQYKLCEDIMVTRTATIIREEFEEDEVPLLHLLTVDLLRKDQIDEESRKRIAPNFNCVIFHDIYRTFFYVRFMKATQCFRMQNFPHLLKNHLNIEQSYFFGDLRVIRDPHEMRANFSLLSLADDYSVMEVLVEISD